MNIEALWAVQFTGARGVRTAQSGGVLVFESNRLFGGDTWMWYTGTYKRHDSGTYEIFLQSGVHYREGGQSIFGEPLQPRRYMGVAQIVDDDHITAKLTVEGNPEMVLTAILARVAPLP
jgi:hypothetical protein